MSDIVLDQVTKIYPGDVKAVDDVSLEIAAGEQLQEHQVHERAYVVVVDGEIEIDGAAGSVSGGPGLLAVFDPHERHEVRATKDARLLLLLAPWPGDGHPGARD